MSEIVSPTTPGINVVFSPPVSQAASQSASGTNIRSTPVFSSSNNLAGYLVFQIEVCHVPRLNLYGLHFKRISGGVWAYKTVCGKLLGLINL